jgi:hypothetical protein
VADESQVEEYQRKVEDVKLEFASSRRVDAQLLAGGLRNHPQGRPKLVEVLRRCEALLQAPLKHRWVFLPIDAEQAAGELRLEIDMNHSETIRQFTAGIRTPGESKGSAYDGHAGYDELHSRHSDLVVDGALFGHLLSHDAAQAFVEDRFEQIALAIAAIDGEDGWPHGDSDDLSTFGERGGVDYSMYELTQLGARLFQRDLPTEFTDVWLILTPVVKELRRLGSIATP